MRGTGSQFFPSAGEPDCQLPSLAAAAIAPSTTVAAGQIAGDHDADGFHPTRYIEHRTEPALGQHIVILDRPLTRCDVAGRFFHAQELESLIVLVIPS